MVELVAVNFSGILFGAVGRKVIIVDKRVMNGVVKIFKIVKGNDAYMGVGDLWGYFVSEEYEYYN